jgi:homoserine kinase type II
MQSSMSGTMLHGERETFAAEELAIVLSHYDLGVIETITKFPRGSRKAPKLLISSEKGRFLLKRRAHGKDDLPKVKFCHALQKFLASQQFPLPHLIETADQQSSMLQWQASVYELFEYIPGQAYSQSLEATFDAGRVLGLFHKLLEAFHCDYQPPTGSYHSQDSVNKGLKVIPGALGLSNELQEMLEFLRVAYAEAGRRVDEMNLAEWPRQYVHADWHPGNMLFLDNRVVAVIDYDSSRLLPRIIDIANGALQFSFIGAPGDEDVARWPDYPDEGRFKRFIRGYDEVLVLSEQEVKAMPWLMAEALIAEAVLPIALTGSFGKVDGMEFLRMVQRKARWIVQHHGRLVELLE